MTRLADDRGWVRRVVVTGGTRGIGRAVAMAAAASGAETIVVNYLQNDAEAERTRGQCEALGAHCIPFRANMASPDEIDRLFSLVHAEIGGIDLFVHCAALNAFKPILRMKPNQWDLTMNIATRAFLGCVQQCTASMSHGSIVAVSSLGSRRVLDSYGAMGPAKAALESLVKYLACECAPLGIRVNAVTAGLVETESIRMFPDAAAMTAAATARTPAGRIAQPADIADVVMFLATPAARWIIGQTIVADGGLSLR